MDDAQRAFFFAKREQPFLKILIIGEMVVKGPFGHPESVGQGLNRECFSSGLFKQGEPFFEPSASAELRYDRFLPLLDTFLLLRAYHMVWYAVKRRMLFSSRLLLGHLLPDFSPGSARCATRGSCPRVAQRAFDKKGSGNKTASQDHEPSLT